MTEKELRKKAMALPLQPGVYIMKNKDKKIYIYRQGKKALKTVFLNISAVIPIIRLR